MSINTEKKSVKLISDQELKAMKNLSAYSLPNTPANSGMKAPQVKPKFYDFVLNSNGTSIYTILNRFMSEVNDAFETFMVNFQEAKNHIDTQTGNPHKVNAEETGAYDKLAVNKFIEDLQNADANLNNTINALKEGILNGTIIVNKSKYSEMFETENGYISFKDLKSSVDTNTNTIKTNKDICDAHDRNTNNPHGVTPEQIGAYTKEETDNKDTAILTAFENHIDMANSKFQKQEVSIEYDEDITWTSVEDALNGLSTILQSFLESKDLDSYIDTLPEVRKEIEKINKSISESMPVASETTIGGVKVGSNLSVTTDGILSVVYKGKNLDEVLDRLLYEGISITTFKANVSTVQEIGKTLNSITFEFDISKEPTTLTLNDINLNVNSKSHTINETINSNKSYTLKASDGQSNSIRVLTVNFYNNIYCGTSSNITDNTKLLTDSYAGTYSVNASYGEYIYFALPTRLLENNRISFWVGGFEGGFEAYRVIDITNNSGYTEEYTVYRSSNSGLGYTRVEVMKYAN